MKRYYLPGSISFCLTTRRCGSDNQTALCDWRNFSHDTDANLNPLPDDTTPQANQAKGKTMKHKLLNYVMIVSTMLTYAAITPQALSEKKQGKPGKLASSKDVNQPNPFQITGTPG